MIIGYQVKNSHGRIWADRESTLVLSESTAISDLNEARADQSNKDYQIVAVVEGSIPNATQEALQGNKEQYRCLAVSSGNISDSDMSQLDELAKSNECNMVLGRETGWFIKIYHALENNMNYPNLSPEFLLLLKEAHNDGYRLLEIDSGIEEDE